MPDIKFIIYNIKGLPGILSNSESNILKITNRIINNGYHVVCFNEVLGEDIRQQIAPIFRNSGYHVIEKAGVDYGLVQDSGLFLASKFPILYHNFEVFTDWKTSEYADQLANKGILGALLDLSSINNGQESYLYAFTTHLHSAPRDADIRSKQLFQAQRFISSMLRQHQSRPNQSDSTILGLSTMALRTVGNPSNCYAGLEYDFPKDWIALDRSYMTSTEEFQIIKGSDTNDTTGINYGETVHFRSHKGTYVDVDKDFYLAADQYSLAHSEVAKWGYFRLLKANNEADRGPIRNGDRVVIKDYDDKYIYSYRKSGKYWACGGGNNAQKLVFEIQLQNHWRPSKIVPLNKANAIFAGDFNLIAASPEYPAMMRTLSQPIDLWKAKYPNQPGFTYSTQNPNQRIDYIINFPHLPSNNAEKLMGIECKEVSVLPWTESDHFPIHTVFSLPDS